MGPRLQERGVSASAGEAKRQQHQLQWGRAYKSAELDNYPAGDVTGGKSFNGAALTRARSSCWLTPASGFDNSFNGAALTRARSSEDFQISRRPSDAASMGPRLQERGVQCAIQCFPGDGICFNGAALTRARSYSIGANAYTLGGRLQWGRAYKSAEFCPSRSPRHWQRGLQWGRAYKSAEFDAEGTVMSLCCCASMGPRLQERGVSGGEIHP